MIKKNSLLLLVFLMLFGATEAQERKIPTDTIVVTKHSVTANGTSFSYTAQTGMLPLWDELGAPIATLNYTYYTRDNIKNRAERPLLISFNGGPGSASVWMQLAYTGPRILNRVRF